MKDKIVEELINAELNRQENCIELIASENIVSQDVLDAVASPLAATANYITDNVNFKEIEEPSEETLVALADIPGALDNDGGCGPDGCEIA